MSINNPSDADDVRLSLGGDSEAFGRLYDRHARTVRTVVSAVSGDFAAVEDMTQEAFLRGYRRLASLRDATCFGPWIQGIARLVARERRRQLHRDRHYFGTDELEVPINDKPHCMVEQSDERRRVLSVVAELPERERIAIHAYYFHGQSAEQAAAAMGMSRSGFYAALERGMDRLRKQLGDASPSSFTTRFPQ